MLPEAGYVWSAYAFPTAVTTVLMLALGARVLIGQRTPVARAFFGMTAASSIWLFTFTFMYCARDAATALGWARAAYFGIPFLAPAIYQFSVETLQLRERRRLATFAGWLLATAFSLIATSSNLLVPGVTRYWWGFYPRYGTSMSVPFLTFFFAYLIAALVEFVRAYPRSRGEERTQIQLLMAAFAVAYLGCVDYLPKFGFAVYPFGYLGLLGFAAIVGGALRRYGLLAITPSVAAPEILATMGEALLVCDGEERIRLANGAAERLLGFSGGELEQRPLAELLGPGSESVREILARSGEGRIERVLLHATAPPSTCR
jgi:Signal transduction histidine kinase, nitrogen specific